MALNQIHLYYVYLPSSSQKSISAEFMSKLTDVHDTLIETHSPREPIELKIVLASLMYL